MRARVQEIDLEGIKKRDALELKNEINKATGGKLHFNNEYSIKDLPENSCVDDGDFWITHTEVGSGEPLKQWIKSTIEQLKP